MSSRKSTRTTRQTRKHLATDFEWEGLPAFDIPPSHPEQRGDDDNLPLLANSTISQDATSKPQDYAAKLFA